jgi:hypothetical protein
MSDDRQTIEHYAQAFERCLAGPAQEKTRSRAELVAHLYDAAEAGETLTNDQAYDLVMKVAAGELDQVEEITAILQGATAPRH